MAFAVLGSISAAATASLGPPGTVATYEMEVDPAERPDFERENRLTVVSARMQLGPLVELPDGGRFQWYGLDWTRLNGQGYRMWALLDGWPTADADPRVFRYLWREPDWPDALQYVHEATGEQVLPRLSLWTYGWPQDPDTGGGLKRAPVAGMPERILLHGWPFRRVSLETDQAVRAPADWTTVKLNPDLLVGWVSNDRDVDGRPHWRMPEGYRYQHKTDEDILADVQAGGSFFPSHPNRDSLPAWLVRSHVFHSNLGWKPTDWPADLYRPNYWGYKNHLDEPNVHLLGLEADNPVEVVSRMQKTVRDLLRGRGEDGEKSWLDSWVDTQFGRGVMSLADPPYPTWEVFFDSAWYQLAVPGLGGIVDQDTKMFGAGTMVEAYNMAFGAQIPPTTENSCAIRVAVMRGAARNFGKRWGVGMYDPDDFKLRSSKMAYFYDRGATYFWTWTGWVGITDNSGLPYPYQRQYFSLIRQAFERNPHRDMDALLKAATVAVVIPYGYTFAPTALNRISSLQLERENGHGRTYRQVLTNAVTEAERLLRLGVEFDIAVDDPLFRPDGYDELIYIQEDGGVRIVRLGHPDLLRDGPRAVERPDLGPAPRLTIELPDPAPTGPGKITVRAVGQIGTGDWAGEGSAPTVNWEVYGPEGLMHLTAYAIFPVRGPQLTFEARSAGTYVVRAAAADVFGRPAIANLTITVGRVSATEPAAAMP